LKTGPAAVPPPEALFAVECDDGVELGGPGNLEPLVPKGFVLEDHEVVLYGLCALCGKKTRRA